jgi:hypothetical protein
MAVSALVAETSKDVINGKCGKIAKRMDAKAAKDLCHLRPLQHLDRLAPQKLERLVMFDNTRRRCCKRRHERTVADADSGSHLLARCSM